jgi:hypothetical protein
MSENDNVAYGGRWRMEVDSDGWRWWTPHWDQRVSTESKLALSVEALRRAVDLRDAAAESGERVGLTARAVFLVSVLNPLYESLVAERAATLGLSVTCPHGKLTDIVDQLLQSGIMLSTEYRAAD